MHKEKNWIIVSPEILKEVQERQEYLRKLVEEMKEKLSHSPQGTLRISTGKNGKSWYYHRKETTDKGGEYIPERETELPRALAQKDYHQRILRSAQAELEATEKYLKRYPACRAEEVYGLLSEKRKRLVNPMVEPDDMMIANWRKVSYTGKTILDDAPELITDQGERVRSKTEVIIANQLTKAGIPYRYEYPLRLRGFGTFYPDFTILHVRLRKDVLWEHLGMMDDPDYAQAAVKKISMYNMNGYFQGDNLIISSETKNHPINTRQIKAMIEHYLT